MNKEEKQEVIEALKSKFSQYSNFYITDTESLSVGQINNLRRHCYDKQVEMRVAKNTLIKKALESLDNEKYSGVYDSLHKVTALMFSESPKDPAVIISSFRKAQNGEKPQLKAAFLNGDIFVGDNQLINLTKIKTKNELIGEVIGLLMSPIQRVIGALQNRPETSEEKAPAAEAAEAKTKSAPEAKETSAKTEEPAKSAEAEAPKAETTEAAEAKVEPAKTEETAKPAEAEAPKAEAAPEVKAENAEITKAEATPEAKAENTEAPKAEAKAESKTETTEADKPASAEAKSEATAPEEKATKPEGSKPGAEESKTEPEA